MSARPAAPPTLEDLDAKETAREDCPACREEDGGCPGHCPVCDAPIDYCLGHSIPDLRLAAAALQ